MTFKDKIVVVTDGAQGVGNGWGWRDECAACLSRRWNRNSQRNEDVNWLILIVAGLFEVVWAVALKMSNGFKNITADAVFVGGMAASVWLLAVAMKSIPMGTAYAVWTGVGAVGGFVSGIVMFGESASALRIASAALIVAGIVGLKLATK